MGRGDLPCGAGLVGSSLRGAARGAQAGTERLLALQPYLMARLKEASLRGISCTSRGLGKRRWLPVGAPAVWVALAVFSRCPPVPRLSRWFSESENAPVVTEEGGGLWRGGGI